MALSVTTNSDRWSSYKCLSNQTPPFRHRDVNHSENFVNPEDPDVHTNNVEAYWKSAKSAFKRMNGTRSDMVPRHLDEFLFRDRIRKDLQLNSRDRGHFEIFVAIMKAMACWLVREDNA